MATMDIFNDDAFSMVSLTAAINKQPYLPSFLGDLGLFSVKRVRTENVAIEDKNGTLSLIQTSERGAPIEEARLEKRNIRDFRTSRIAKGSTIKAATIQNIRAFGSELELKAVETEVMDHEVGIVRDVNLTWENMRLGAVQGIVTDADASTIYNWFTEWGVTQPTEVDWDLDNASPTSGAVRQLCNSTTRTAMRALGGLWIPGRSYLLALCGDNFFDNITQHPEVRQTFLNTQEAADLRDNHQAFSAFRYGGITWVNYRGTDDNSTVAINTDKAKFVPVGVPGLFEVAFSPSEALPYTNTPGLELYSMMVYDKDRQFWVRPEVYSYPLFYCTRPAALLRGKRT